MITLKYITHKYSLPLEYTLFQYQNNESFFVYVGDTLIGSIAKAGDRWVQVSGRDLGDSNINEIGEFIDKTVV
ncbi:MAG: hypothetical protein EOO47_27185 [Flavobacterium sp.]|nr:MAG: hypothetical protein EOO47_27185 [Flavobacterium sp.]